MHHISASGRLLTVLLVILTLPLLVLGQERDIEPVELRVMTFNIWLGGELVDFGKIIEAIQAADADVVGLQESEGNERRLAEALGWQHVSERMQIISRFPIIDPPDGNGIYVFIQTGPGQVVAMANVHLPSSPYGPELVRDGSTLDEVLENDRITRLSVLEPHLDVLPELVEAGIPVVLTGDFNTPSHLDWTAEMTEVRDQVLYPVEWPVTMALEAAGFRDTYRAVYPDPAGRAGITWTPGYPYPRLNPGEVIDRIDMIHVAGEMEIIDSQIVGESGGQDVDIPISPYPSDHRGVVSTLHLTPAEPPLFVAVQHRSVTVGEPIVVRYHAPGGEDTDRIVIVPADGSVVDDALMSLPPQEAGFNGAVTFGTALLEPGEYAAVLVGADGEEASRSQFWVVAPDARPLVGTTQASYAVGEPIEIEWQNAPGFRWDWAGIYAAGDSDLYNYWGFIYTQATVAGTGTFDDAALGEAMLPPGDYEVRLMRDDGYVILAMAEFTVTE